tara:strand:- start:3976 stop:4257 length:282 start_codon:yes stop_codon:yes gene_type:complete
MGRWLMASVSMVNGHRPTGLMQLLSPALAATPRPDRTDVKHDLDASLAAVVALSDLYRQRWEAGEAGVKICYTLLRHDDVVTPGSPAAIDTLF